MESVLVQGARRVGFPAFPSPERLAPQQLRHCGFFPRAVATAAAAASAEPKAPPKLGRRNRNAGAQPAVEPSPMRQAHCVRIPVGDREIVIETGSIGRQAGGAVTITDGETILYTTVCSAEEPSQFSDFVPLYVHYQERFSAVGRTSGAFNKREGRPQNHEITVSRIIDRSLRPMIDKGYFHEIQVLSWVLSYDGCHLPEPLAITAAGAAIAISNVPLAKPVAGVRVGLIRGSFVLNPTAEQMRASELDMVLAGTSDSVLMIEGYCNFLSEDELLKAIEVGQHAVSLICKELEMLRVEFGRRKSLQRVHVFSPEIELHIKTIVGNRLRDALHVNCKQKRSSKILALERLVCQKLCVDVPISDDIKEKVDHANAWIDDELEVKDGDVDQGDIHITPTFVPSDANRYGIADVKLAFKEFTSFLLRTMVVQEKLRSDGRGISALRQIKCSCGLIPRAHGSAIFTRVETQALVVVTLGDESMAQRKDTITDVDELKRFYVQYVFPHCCVGEVGRIGTPSRREIGHGMLVERALEPALPSQSEFPYTIRVESMITESNGSSSMASVCGASLAMYDAGVPLKCSIAGVAMGLILDPTKYGGRGGPVILTDILGSEDAFGDMDFKVAGGEEGITAFQMDVKVDGITLSTLKRTLSKARTARLKVLKEMSESDPPPSSRISKHAGVMDMVKIKREQIKEVIGTGGKTVRQIIDDSGVENVVVKNDGSVHIIGKDREKVEMAKERIRSIAFQPAVGTIYRNCAVKSISSFGCFVELTPGREALCHISELSTRRLAKVEDAVAAGDRLDVKVIEVNARGQIRVSHRALLESQMVLGEFSSYSSEEQDEVIVNNSKNKQQQQQKLDFSSPASSLDDFLLNNDRSGAASRASSRRKSRSRPRRKSRAD